MSHGTFNKLVGFLGKQKFQNLIFLVWLLLVWSQSIHENSPCKALCRSVVKNDPKNGVYTLSRISIIKGGRVGQQMFTTLQNFMVLKTHVVCKAGPVTTNSDGSIL